MHTGFRLQFIFLLFIITSCNTGYRSTQVEYKDYRVVEPVTVDSSLVSLLQPYTDSVNKSMNDVIGVSDKSLDKALPECTLGNIMADALLVKSREKFHTNVDAAFMNYGGIRLTQITPGPVTKRKVYELMPFDNIVIVQKVNGEVLQQFLDHIAKRGGWPVSGMKFRIKNQKAVDIMIQDKPIDKTAVYSIVNSDYVANGGDECIMLKNIPQQNIGYLVRDALMEYFASFKANGKNITANIENRVVND
jgi:2',3'-cyclic-nucleotide 2'-phosphodiesterase (5'-nucleotidase family)